MSIDTRTPSAIDEIAERYLNTMASLDPFGATTMGIKGFDHLVTDYSPSGIDARAAAAKDTLEALGKLTPVDDIDRVTLSAMRERLGLELELHESGWTYGDLNVIASPLQEIRDVFDLAPTATVEDWENIAARLELLPSALESYTLSLRYGASIDRVSAVRQVTAGIEQAEELSVPGSFFFMFVASPAAQAATDQSPTGAQLRERLESAAQGAADAYGRLAQFLSDELEPQAPEADACGRQRYELASRLFLGATIDLDETYAWGLAELDRIIAEQQAIAEELCGPGATVEQAVAHLDQDPARTLQSTDELQAWMQQTSDAAIAALNGVHFDIPQPVLELECMIAPTQTGGIYYTAPSDDFSRPGRMWWSVPAEVTTFNTWREKTTVYHEGVPGHHLQAGQAVYQRESLNLWRRLGCWVSGHGEGWALYAERLMADLGFLDDLGDRLGMLDGQRLRAARVVLDIGVHLELPCPEQWGGGVWDADKAWTFLKANVNMPEAFIRFELDRYLGWPGQAPSYKVGQRIWEEIRDSAEQQAKATGQEFDLKAFHAHVLSLGSVGLDVLKEALA